MIEEQYVSFETAKLAKEKGFDIPTRYGFSERRSLVRVDTSDNWNQDKELYSRPTQSLLARWLREKKRIYIEVILASFYSDALFRLCIYNMNEPEYNSDNPRPAYYDTYEKAMEAGLQEALNLLS